MNDNRKHRRFPLRMPVLCEGPAVREYRALGLTQNVSQGGLLIEVPRLLAEGTATSLRLLTGDRIAHAEAVVAWSVEASLNVMGLQFTMLTAADHRAWEQLLAFQAGPHPRASLRIPVDFTVTCLIPPVTGVQGLVKNLSDDGMMIVLPRAVPPQTRVSVAVPAWLILPPVEAKPDESGAKEQQRPGFGNQPRPRERSRVVIAILRSICHRKRSIWKGNREINCQISAATNDAYIRI